MSRRFRPTDAFVDEPIRGKRYLMGCVLIEARDLPATRAAIGALPTRGRRLHFNNEVDASGGSSCQRSPTYRCVHSWWSATDGTPSPSSSRASLPDRDRERGAVAGGSSSHPRKPAGRSRDARVISRVRQPQPPLVFEHRTAEREPMLGLADGITWSAGAGASWQARIDPLVHRIIELRP